MLMKMKHSQTTFSSCTSSLASLITDQSLLIWYLKRYFSLTDHVSGSKYLSSAISKLILSPASKRLLTPRGLMTKVEPRRALSECRRIDHENNFNFFRNWTSVEVMFYMTSDLQRQTFSIW